ncbi:hypothetical protein ABIA33_005621 [Streptacidiphilus sp. MAP12-16]|uniref:hypothetical protein n=1 Tax=Streptacidiphilus sp. MAP12-16 TaxID=3156300 RepID=UPI0035198308
MALDEVGAAVVAAWCSDLERLRADRQTWRSLAYLRGEDERGYECDLHELARARALWTLQYASTPEDLPLLRFLLGQEATARSEDPFQGCGEELELAGLLVAEHRQVHDVALQWQAKTANFDTWCGYDLAFVLAGGVEDTVAFVRAGALEDREALLQRITGEQGGPAMSQEDVDAWLVATRERFPRDPADEAPWTWMDRLRRLGDGDGARHYLRLWAVELPQDNPHALGGLQRELAEFGDFTEAADVQRRVLALIQGPDARAAGLRRLAELTRLSGDFTTAWQSLQDSLGHLDDQPGWRDAGLGRSFIEEHFLLAAAATDDSLARIVLDAGHRYAGTVPRLPLSMLEVAVRAAVRVGDADLAWHYRTVCDTERRRIEAGLG